MLRRALFLTLSLFHYEQDELLSARNVTTSPARSATRFYYLKRTNTATGRGTIEIASRRSTFDPSVLRKAVRDLSSVERKRRLTRLRALARPVFFLSTMRGSRFMSFAEGCT